MRRFIAIAAALLLALGAVPAKADEPLPLTVYLYDPCGGCAGVIRGCNECKEELALINKLSMQLRHRLDGGQVVLRTKNLLDPVYSEDFVAHMDALGASVGPDDLPVYVVGEGEYARVVGGANDTAFLSGAIQEALDKRAALGLQDEKIANEEPEEEIALLELARNDDPADIAEGDSVIVYFYKEWCPYCIELKALMDAIPETVTLPDGTASQVRFIGLNKENQEEMAIVEAYYDLLDIDEDRQLVPMVIVGESDLFLYDEIVPGLLTGLLAGEAIHTPTTPLMKGE